MPMVQVRSAEVGSASRRSGIQRTDAKELPYVVWWNGRIVRFCRTEEEAERALEAERRRAQPR